MVVLRGAIGASFLVFERRGKGGGGGGGGGALQVM